MKNILLLIGLFCLKITAQYVEVDAVIARNYLTAPYIITDSADFDSLNVNYLWVKDSLIERLYAGVIPDSVLVEEMIENANYILGSAVRDSIYAYETDSGLARQSDIHDSILANVPGSDKEIIWNDNGSFGSSSNFKYDVGGFGDIYTGTNSIIGSPPFAISTNYNTTIVQGGLSYATLGGYNFIAGANVCNNCATFGSILIGGYSDGGGSGGYTADDMTAPYGVVVGSGAAGVHIDGDFPTYYGYQAGTYLQDDCDMNTIIGATALSGGVTSNPFTDNVDSTIAIGYSAGGNIGSNSNMNIFLGNESFYTLGTKLYNIGIGNRSGYNVTTGSGNILIGHYAGDDLTSENFRFIIENGAYKLMDFDFDADTGNIDSDVRITGDLTVDGDLYYNPSYSKSGFADSAVVITGDVAYQQITNAYDSLFRVSELEGITYIAGDTFQITKSGFYNVYLNVRGYGNAASDWNSTVAWVNGAPATNEEYNIIEFTTTGATNKNGGSITALIDFNAGDKVYAILKRTGGTGDFTITSGTLNIQEYYLKP